MTRSAEHADLFFISIKVLSENFFREYSIRFLHANITSREKLVFLGYAKVLL